jgi:hypothetical protein
VTAEDGGCAEKADEAVACSDTEDYKVELFDLVAQQEQELALPPSLGSFLVTREMLQCLTNDKIRIHFEYGKRSELAGAEACFDHTPYINPATGQEDNIPFTVLDICSRANRSRARCFLYSYQVALQVNDVQNPPMLENRVYTKVTFKAFNKLVVLPGDQVKARFTTEYSEQDAVRVMPDIYSPTVPSPIKERYQFNGLTSLPCDDRKVADALQCQNFSVYCVDPNQRINLTVQGTGNVYKIDTTCAAFMRMNQFEWDEAQTLLDRDNVAFKAAYGDRMSQPTRFTMDEVSFKNKFDVMQTEKGWFTFEYEVGQRLHSNEPRCFQGVQLEQQIPTCQFQCQGRECYL